MSGRGELRLHGRRMHCVALAWSRKETTIRMIFPGWRAAGSLIFVVLLLAGCGTELVAQPAEPPTPSPAPTRPPYAPEDLQIVKRQDVIDSLTGRATVQPKVTDKLFFKR